MTTAIIQYPLPPGAPIDAVKSGFLEVAPFFQRPPGLLRKYFLLSDNGATGGGVYLWNSRQTAQDFCEATIRPMIKERFHVEPSITYFETPVIVDNVSSEILFKPTSNKSTSDWRRGSVFASKDDGNH